MKFQIPGSMFQTGCALALQAVPQGMARPILSNLLLEAKDNVLRLIGTDLESSIQASLESPGASGEGRVLVPASRLHAIAREGSEGDVTLETNAQGLRISFSGGRFRLPVSDPAEFPNPREEEKAGIEIEASVLLEMFRKTLFAAAKEISAYTLNGVFVKATGGKIEMVGTDGKKMARVRRSVPGTESFQGILPLRLAQQMEKTLAAAPEGAKALFWIGDRRARVQADAGPSLRVTVSGRLVDGKYPDYEAVIPKAGKRGFSVDRERLGEAIRRAALLSDAYSRLIRMHIEKGILSIRGESRDAGESEAEVPVDYAGDAFDIGFNADYLSDLVRAVSDAALRVQFGESADEFGRFEAGEDYVYVVAPIDLEGNAG